MKLLSARRRSPWIRGSKCSYCNCCMIICTGPQWHVTVWGTSTHFLPEHINISPNNYWRRCLVLTQYKKWNIGFIRNTLDCLVFFTSCFIVSLPVSVCVCVLQLLLCVTPESHCPLITVSNVSGATVFALYADGRCGLSLSGGSLVSIFHLLLYLVRDRDWCPLSTCVPCFPPVFHV